MIEAFGATDAVAAAYAAATRRFTGLLDELVQELPLLRTQAQPCSPPANHANRILPRAAGEGDRPSQASFDASLRTLGCVGGGGGARIRPSPASSTMLRMVPLPRFTEEDDGGSTVGRTDPGEQSPAPIQAKLAGVVARRDACRRCALRGRMFHHADGGGRRRGRR